MRRILIFFLCAAALSAKAQPGTVKMMDNDISTLSKDHAPLYKIEVLPQDSGYAPPEQARTAPYSIKNEALNFLFVDERSKYLPGAKKVIVRFYIARSIKAEELRYSIEENGTTKAANWAPLPDRRIAASGNEFNIFEIKNVRADNRFLHIGIYSIKDPGAVLFQTTSTINLAKPALAVFFTFQKDKPDTTKGEDGVINVQYNSFDRNMSGVTFNNKEVVINRTLFIKTDNAPQLFNLLIKYDVNEYMYFKPRWIKLSANVFTPLEDSMRAEGYNYKAEVPQELVRFSAKLQMFLYYNFTQLYGKKNKDFSYSSNDVEFTVKDVYVLSARDWLLISLVIGLPLSSIALLFILWYRGKQKRKLQQQRYISMEAKLKLQSIRSQLNPHFIFNALSGIQNLVHKNETGKAETYLGTFSRLTRNVLDDSDKEMITLHNEIKLLDDYLKMEQLRFGFQYHILANEDLDRYNIELPAMLLQPLIENAVKHGIASLKANGMITIDFEKSEDDLAIRLTDNGIGFDEVKEYNGMGLRLTRNRISLLNTVYKNTPVGLEMQSGTNGTIVIITLKNWLV